MAKTFPSNFNTQVTSVQSKTAELYDFYLLDSVDSTTFVLRLTDSDQNIGFYDPYDDSTQQYSSFPLNRSSIRYTAGSEIDTVDISGINVSKELSGYLANNTFRGWF